MEKSAELDLLKARDGEVPDLSPNSFRFAAVLMVAAAILMLAGVL